MSQMMLRRPRHARAAVTGPIVPFECAVCGRGVGDGAAVTASSEGGVSMMLCDSHLRVRGA